MFGRNALRGQEILPHLWIVDHFVTIQGEGPHAGRPALFLRTGGCNLRCWFCDTNFDEGGAVLPPEDWANWCFRQRQENPGCNLVVLTGGEPLRQNIYPLVLLLLENDFEVQIETAGTLALPDGQLAALSNHRKFSVVVSPKTGKVNDEVKAVAKAYKYIIRAGETCREDGLPLCSTQKEDGAMKLARPPKSAKVYVQPMDEYNAQRNSDNYRETVRVAQRFGYRISFQMHKFLEVP